MFQKIIKCVFIVCCAASIWSAFPDSTVLAEDDKKEKSATTKKSVAEKTEKSSTNMAEKKEEPKASSKKRDPFQTTDEIRARASKSFPNIRIIGIATDHTSKAVAILEVQGAGIYFVRPDDKISLRLRAGSSSLLITKITENNVLVKIGSIGDELIIR